jgi:hypothetical protein
MLIFVPWYRIPSIFLLCGMVRNRIPRVCFFCSMVQNSEPFSPLRNGSEQNSANCPGSTPIGCRTYTIFFAAVNYNDDLWCFKTQNLLDRGSLCLRYPAYATSGINNFLFHGTDFRAFFSCAENGWERNFLLAALLLEGELYLEAGVAPHHEEEAGVDVLQVRLVAPRHADHLSEH